MAFYATSIYIPRISVNHTEDTIRKVMEYYRIGTVRHVDFIPINKKPGFVENFDQVIMSAFVYFSDPWLSSADDMYSFKNETYNGQGHIEFWDTIACDQSYILHLNEKEYWICLKNKKPVQRTMMNIHQVVENGRYLENLVQEQAKKIEELERKLEYIQNIVNGNTVRSEQKFWNEFKVV
jgi:hypothetical protein